jgi:hypothetical protein
MTKTAQAFNAWMHDYIKHPAKFERQWKSVARFIAEKSSGKTPTYGEACAALLRRYIAKQK